MFIFLYTVLILSQFSFAIDINFINKNCDFGSFEDLTLNKSKLLVAHGTNASLSELDTNLTVQKTYFVKDSDPGRDSSELFADTTVDENGYLYSTVYRLNKIAVLDKNLELIKYLDLKGIVSNPIGIFYINKKIFIASHSSNVISVINKNGVLEFSFGNKLNSPSNNNGEFAGAYDIEYFNEKLYISDRGNNRVNVFSLEGKFLFSFGQGYLTSPHNMSIDSKGRIFVTSLTDTNSRTRLNTFSKGGISVFDKNGTYLKSIKSNEIIMPKAIAVNLNHLYVTSGESETSNKRCIKKFSLYGDVK